MQLILNLQKKLGIAVIFITHNLGVVAKIADYVNVMYAGKVVETGKAEDIFFRSASSLYMGDFFQVCQI